MGQQLTKVSSPSSSSLSSEEVVRILKCPFCHSEVKETDFMQHVYGDPKRRQKPLCNQVRELHPRGMPRKAYDKIMVKALQEALLAGHAEQCEVVQQPISDEEGESTIDKRLERPHLSVEDVEKNEEDLEKIECKTCNTMVNRKISLMLPCCSKQPICFWCIVNHASVQYALIRCFNCKKALTGPSRTNENSTVQIS